MADAGSTGQRRHAASIVWLAAYLLAGPLIWAVQFSTVYALHALACATQPAGAGGWLSLSMMIVTVAAVAAALAVLVFGRLIRRMIRISSSSSNESGRSAYGILSNLLIVLSIVAISWSGLTIAVLEACNGTQI
jgi:hypothetical protein